MNKLQSRFGNGEISIGISSGRRWRFGRAEPGRDALARFHQSGPPILLESDAVDFEVNWFSLVSCRWSDGPSNIFNPVKRFHFLSRRSEFAQWSVLWSGFYDPGHGAASCGVGCWWSWSGGECTGAPWRGSSSKKVCLGLSHWSGHAWVMIIWQVTVVDSIFLHV